MSTLHRRPVSVHMFGNRSRPVFRQPVPDESDALQPGLDIRVNLDQSRVARSGGVDEYSGDPIRSRRMT